MKTKIQEVRNYFTDKLTRGLYKVIEAYEHHITVRVDKKYKYSLWLSDNHIHFSTWSDSFMDLKFTEAQKKTGWKIADRKRKLLWVDTKEKEERAELKRLQEKYPDSK